MEPTQKTLAPAMLNLLHGFKGKRPLVQTRNECLKNELFGTLTAALRHEFGNQLSGMKMLLYLRTRDKDPHFLNLIVQYNRICMLCSLTTANGPATTSYQTMDDLRSARLFFMPSREIFSAIELDSLELASDGNRLRASCSHAIYALGQDIATEFLHGVHYYMEMFRTDATSDQESATQVLRSLQFGEIIAKSLRNLFLGEPDLTAIPFSMALQLMEETAKSTGCEIDLSGVREAEVGNVMAEPGRFSIVTSNIFVNARRAMDTRGVQPVVKATLKTMPTNVRIGLTDRGVGMPLELMRMLNQGTRITTKTQTEGVENGLGFAACRTMVKDMGGRLYVERSEPDNGTTVALQLSIAAQ